MMSSDASRSSAAGDRLIRSISAMRAPPRSKLRGALLADQVESLDWRARGARLLCRIPAAVVQEALGKVRTLLSG